jgi:hypothetical protein
MGLTIAPTSSVDVSMTNLYLANSCSDLQSFISNGIVIVNDGVHDLNPSDAKKFLNDEYFNEYAPLNHTHVKTEIIDFAHNHDANYYNQSQIDSKLGSLNYSAISKIDGSTNVTGVELENLTNGTNADGLHSHSFPNVNNMKLDDFYSHSNGSSQININNGYVYFNASNGWSNLRFNNLTYTPNQSLTGGQICFRNNVLYVFDDARNKWLSIDSVTFQAFSTSPAYSGYLSCGNVMSSIYGFVMPFDGTITSLSISNQNTNPGGRVTVRKSGADSGADLMFSGASSFSDSINTDFNAGDVLQVYIDQCTTAPDKSAVIFIVRRRI